HLAEKILTSRNPPERERKQVTELFAERRMRKAHADHHRRQRHRRHHGGPCPAAAGLAGAIGCQSPPRRGRREGRRVMAWVRMRKGVVFLPRYRQICAQTNTRYLDVGSSMTRRRRFGCSIG